MQPARLVAVAVLPLVACFGNDDSCEFTFPDHYVNPSTLACELHAPAESCGPPADGVTWGACPSPCDGLDQAACVGTSTCRAAFDHDCFFGVGACPRPSPYLGCYPTDQNLDDVTPCSGLDAWSCSRHQACSATYRTAATCFDRVDSDGDTQIDEADECGLAYARCVPEPTAP